MGEDNFKESSFDIIIFRGVIEHILEPKKALERATALKERIIHFCATPNLKSFGADFYRENGIFRSNRTHKYI